MIALLSHPTTAAQQGLNVITIMLFTGLVFLGVIGLDPVTAYSASAPLPKHIDELMFAGFLRGDSVDVVKGVTVDLEVPANAEVVLEGYVEQGELVKWRNHRRRDRKYGAGAH